MWVKYFGCNGVRRVFSAQLVGMCVFAFGGGFFCSCWLDMVLSPKPHESMWFGGWRGDCLDVIDSMSNYLVKLAATARRVESTVPSTLTLVRSRDELIEQAVRQFFDERQRGQQRLDALRRIGQMVDHAGLYEGVLLPSHSVSRQAANPQEHRPKAQWHLVL